MWRWTIALIPPFFIDCVVAIGARDSEGKTTWIASGFLYGHKATGDEVEQAKYLVYLVSNRHVFQDLARACLRFNPQAGGPAREYDLNLLDADGAPLWFCDPNEKIDVGVIPINFNVLKEHAMQVAFFASDTHAAPIDKLTELGIAEGDFAYALGFPMGIVGQERATVIVRSGTIARIRDTLARNDPEFLVDVSIFPGNSGGPVVSKPEAMSIKGTKSQSAAYLIGVVTSYVPYRDVAISSQTKRPRVIFEENSGLAAAHPIDFVQEAILKHIETLGGLGKIRDGDAAGTSS